MTLKEFLKVATKHERGEVAAVCNNSVGYLYQLAGTHRFASPYMATFRPPDLGERPFFN